MWAIKDKSIGNTFFDSVAGKFFTPRLTNATRNQDAKTNEPSKRLKYIVDSVGSQTNDELGSALGPDWVSTLNLTGSASKNVIVERETDVKGIYRSVDLSVDKRSQIERIKINDQQQEGEEEPEDWPVYVELSNGKVYGCDFIVSATGVLPNSEIIADSGVELAEDGGLKVRNKQQCKCKLPYFFLLLHFFVSYWRVHKAVMR